MDERAAIHVRSIRRVYPDLVITSAWLDASGQNNDILICNEDLIFRFPRYADAIPRLRTESALLRAIRSVLPLPIPNPLYTSFDPPQVGQAFMGYPMLPGKPLWHETLAAFDETTAAATATRLASFLHVLHTIPADAIPIDLPTLDGRHVWRDMYDRIRDKLFPFMRPDARAWTTQLFEAFLNDPRSTAWTPALRHGDFGPSNILCDPMTGAITGIIDFGSAAWGDPAVDIAALSSYGADFRARLCDALSAMRSVAPRITFYASTFALQEALFGIEHNDPDAFAAGIARYR